MQNDIKLMLNYITKFFIIANADVTLTERPINVVSMGDLVRQEILKSGITHDLHRN